MGQGRADSRPRDIGRVRKNINRVRVSEGRERAGYPKGEDEGRVSEGEGVPRLVLFGHGQSELVVNEVQELVAEVVQEVATVAGRGRRARSG